MNQWLSSHYPLCCAPSLQHQSCTFLFLKLGSRGILYCLTVPIMCRLGVDAAAEGCEFPSRLRHRSRSKWSQLGSSTVVAVAIVSLLFVGASQGLVAHSSGLRRWQRSSPAFSSPLSYPDSAGKICSYRHERFLPRCSHSVDDGCHDTKTVHTLLIDNYDSYTYNLFQQLAVTNGRAPFVVYNDDEGGDLWWVSLRVGKVRGRPDRKMPSFPLFCSTTFRRTHKTCWKRTHILLFLSTSLMNRRILGFSFLQVLR